MCFLTGPNNTPPAQVLVGARRALWGIRLNLQGNCEPVLSWVRNWRVRGERVEPRHAVLLNVMQKTRHALLRL